MKGIESPIKEEERIHLKYMETRKVGEVEEDFNPEKDAEKAYKQVIRRIGVSLPELYIEKLLGVVLEGKDYMPVRELGNALRKYIGDKTSTEMKVSGMSSEEKERVAEEFVNGLLKK